MRQRGPTAPATAWSSAPALGGGQPPAGGTRFAAPAAHPGERLPQPPRERKPALAALAVLLILGGALGSATLVLRSGKTVAVIEVAHDVPAGAPIALTDLREAEVSNGGGLPTIAWGQRVSVARYYAAVGLVEGALLAPRMVSGQGAVGPGSISIGLSLTAAQMPEGLVAGDHIRLYSTDPTLTGPRILTTAVISGVSADNSGGNGGNTILTVVVAEAVAPLVLTQAKAQNVVAALLPATDPSAAGTSPAAGTSAGPTVAPVAPTTTVAPPTTVAAPTSVASKG